MVVSGRRRSDPLWLVTTMKTGFSISIRPKLIFALDPRPRGYRFEAFWYTMCHELEITDGHSWTLIKLNKGQQDGEDKWWENLETIDSAGVTCSITYPDGSGSSIPGNIDIAQSYI